MSIEEKIRRHHDGRQHIVEIVGNAARELPDRIHLLLLLKAVLERPLRRRFQRIDDCGFAVAIFFLDGQHKKVCPALCASRQCSFHRGDATLALGCLANSGLEHRSVALHYD